MLSGEKGSVFWTQVQGSRRIAGMEDEHGRDEAPMGRRFRMSGRVGVVDALVGHRVVADRPQCHAAGEGEAETPVPRTHGGV